MSLPELVAGVMVLGLVAYAVLGGADFGVGVWDLTAGRGARGERMRAMIERAMGSVWETNHVWLIFVLVVFWTAFPVAFGSVASTLFVPLFLAAVGIIFRGTTFALRGVPAGPATGAALTVVFALSSVLTPFFLGTLVGAVASGGVPIGNASGDAVGSWWNPTSVTVGLIAVVTGAHLAAVYLAADSARAGLDDLAARFRVRALASGAVAGLAAMGGLLVLRADARDLFDGLTAGAGLVFVVLSAAAGMATLGLLWLRRPGVARVTAATAVAAIVVGFVAAQAPDLLPGEITVEEAAAPQATLLAVLVGGGIGMLVLVPALWYLFRLRFTGRLDKDVPALAPERTSP